MESDRRAKANETDEQQQARFTKVRERWHARTTDQQDDSQAKRQATQGQKTSEQLGAQNRARREERAQDKSNRPETDEQRLARLAKNTERREQWHYRTPKQIEAERLRN